MQAGLPLSDFEVAADVLQTLQKEGKYQIFLARPDSIRLIGDSDQFRVSLAKRLGGTAVDGKRSDSLLREIQMFLQIAVVAEKVSAAARILEENVFDDELQAAKDNEALQKELRAIIAKKLEIVLESFTSDALRDRMRRLGTTVGPLVQDLDFDLVSQRQAYGTRKEIGTPFLRLRVRYSSGGKRSFPFLPPWLPDAPTDVESFELECDETDIDLLVSRLLQAKELLRTAIEARVAEEKV